MKLAIEYPIALDAIPRRSTNHKLTLVRDVFEVDIPECSVSEMPVAFREHIKDDGRRSAVTFRAMGGRMYTAMTPPVVDRGRVRYEFGHRDLGQRSTLFHGKAHVLAVSAVDERCRKLKSASRSGIYPEGVVASYSWAKAIRMDTPAPQPVELPFLADGAVTAYDEVAVESARARIAEVCGKIVVMEGRFMMARPEPIYMVDNRFYEEMPCVRLIRDFDPRNETADEDAEEPNFERMPFALTDLDLAVDYATEMWRLVTGREAQPVVEGNTIELVDQSYVTFDGDAAAVANTARIMQDRFVQSMPLSVRGNGWFSRRYAVRELAELEADSFAAFQSLSVALEDYAQGADGEGLRAAVRQALSSSGGKRFLAQSELPFAELSLGRMENRQARRNFGISF